MILNQKETMLSYRCPECGMQVKSMIGIFTLSGDMLRLKCPCEGSYLDIVRTKDKKLRLTVPCFACPSPHSYVLSNETFFNRDFLALGCSYSGLDICFIGNEKKVEEAIDESERELEELLGEHSFEDFSHNRGGDGRELTDPSLLETIDYMIKELEEENAIHCSCPDKGEYEVEIHDDTFVIKCHQCGCKKTLPAGSVLAVEELLMADELDLTEENEDDE